LFVSHWAKALGGAEHSLLDILVDCAPHADCHLITSEDGALVNRAIAHGVTCHVVECTMHQRAFLRNKIMGWFLLLPDIAVFFAYILKVNKLGKRLRPDVIHANVPKSHVTVFILRLFGCRTPCCFHIREIFPKLSIPTFIYTLLFPQKQSTVIAISHAVQKSLPKNMQAHSIVIHNGVDIVESTPPRPDDKTLRFLYLGRIVPWKGCHFLIDAFYQARQRLPEARMSLSLIGDTAYWPQNYREQLHDKIHKLNIDKCCFILPNTSDVAAVFQTHDIFVNASHNEPFGRSIAEAQGAGLPVIAFDSGGVGEIVEQNTTGILVAENDSKSFVNAIIDLSQNAERRISLGKAGQLQAEKYFNKINQLPKIRNVILDLSGNRSLS